MSVIRPAAVAGTFYPGTPQELKAMLVQLLGDVDDQQSDSVPKALVAPHAGYVYSGSMAARAYATLKPARDLITRVVLLGPCHRVALKGLALSSADGFTTPLGDIEIDKITSKKIENLPQVSTFDQTHAAEHSLEVHLPFLQMVLGDFKLIPLVVGDCSKEDVAQVLDTLWGGGETLIVISTDLSHFLDYDAAVEIDTQTCHAIEQMEPDNIGRDQACGRIPLKGLLTLAKYKNMHIETLGINNSGDTAGDKDRVVGYGSWAFYEAFYEQAEEGNKNQINKTHQNIEAVDFEQQTASLLNEYGETLLGISAASIQNGLINAQAVKTQTASFPEPLRSQGACFITLKIDGNLRGCIGSPEAHRPLIEDVAQNAYAAGFQDPRFPKIQPAEIPKLSLSVSVLSPATPMDIKDEADLLNQLRPGIDGLIIQDGPRRALFLPSVWEQLPEPENFLSRLKIKAGMRAEHWSETFTAHRFITGEVKQSDLKDPQSIWSDTNNQN